MSCTRPSAFAATVSDSTLPESVASDDAAETRRGLLEEISRVGQAAAKTLHLAGPARQQSEEHKALVTDRNGARPLPDDIKWGGWPRRPASLSIHTPCRICNPFNDPECRCGEFCITSIW